eukprot:14281460-Alexandrium_andersonii.AAC.1
MAAPSTGVGQGGTARGRDESRERAATRRDSRESKRGEQKEDGEVVGGDTDAWIELLKGIDGRP